jgi:hypothetical protein
MRSEEGVELFLVVGADDANQGLEVVGERLQKPS